MATLTYNKDNYHDQNFVRVVDQTGTDIFGTGTTSTQVQGNTASGTTDAGNPVKIGGIFSATQPTVTTGQRVDWNFTNRGAGFVTLEDQSGNIVAVSVPSADAQNAGQTLSVTSYGRLWNGTTFDRIRDAASTNATTGSGLQAAGILGKYNSSVPTYTDGQYGNIQLDANGAVRSKLITSAAAGSDAIANRIGFALGGDQTTTNLVATAGVAFNGTTFDRNRTIQGVDGTGLGVQAVATGGAKFSNITTATTTVVKSGAGTLSNLIINTPIASSTITLYNNTTATGAKIATITLPATITGESPFVLDYNLAFSTGLTIVTSGATDITVTYW